MKHSHRLHSSHDPLPPRFLSCLVGFADLFTRPTWPNVLILLAGVILTPGRRTIAAALRILGLERDPKFCTFHRILNPAAWSPRAAASRLLLMLIATFLPAAAPVVIETRSNGAGAPRSAPEASIVIPSAPLRGTSSKPAVCAGFPPCCWCTCRGPTASWHYHSSLCSHPPSASMQANCGLPRHWSIGRGSSARNPAAGAPPLTPSCPLQVILRH